MFYETAHTVGPGWQRSFKPSHYEDMSWSPSSSHFRSPGASPETYRRRIHTEDEFPYTSKEGDDEFFRRSPTFPRRIFKEVWTETTPSHRFGDRPRMFKRVFRPNQWEDEFEGEGPTLRRVDRGFDDPRPRKFEEEFERHFPRDLKKDIEDEFEKSEGRVHHIPIMVERRMEDLKSKYGKKSSPPEKAHEEEYSEDWEGPQVQRLRKTFEKDDGFPSRRFQDMGPRSRVFSNTIPETWDPHAVHTLPTRRGHKSSQSFDDSRHPVPPKHVFRSYSETHEDVPKPQQHSAAFRSHSDGHCPNQTYVTKIQVGVPTTKKDEQCSTDTTAQSDRPKDTAPEGCDSQQVPEPEARPKGRGPKPDSPALQQIAVVLQNVEDLVQRVESYSGTGRDKQYRFLDEMLTRCMLRLDDVDTEGREDIRAARKEAVREVQACVDLLEAKADESERRQKLHVIPLGDVPRKEEPKEHDNVKEVTESEQKQDSKQDKNEQTKL